MALVTGLRFDVLELPAAAGRGVLRRVGAATGPVALAGSRMRLLVAAGSAEELPGLLDWLEWGGIALDLAALGTGGRMTAPRPRGGTAPGRRTPRCGCGPRAGPWGRALAPGRAGRAVGRRGAPAWCGSWPPPPSSATGCGC